MYHCGTAPVAMHIANGMYGALVVDPARPLSKAKEFVLVQSEFYLSPKPGGDGAYSLDWAKLLGLAPDHIVFNGRASQYAEHPIDVAAGELVRLYVVNAGPNRISSFHVVGGIFERVFEDGSQANPLGRGTNGERPRGRRSHLRDPAARAGRLSVRHSCVRGRDQGRGRGTARRPTGEDRQMRI